MGDWIWVFFILVIERGTWRKELCQIELPGGVLFLSDSRMLHDGRKWIENENEQGEKEERS